MCPLCAYREGCRISHSPHGKGGGMRDESITWRDYALALALLALLLLALAIQGGAWGPSDLELFKRAAGL